MHARDVYLVLQARSAVSEIVRPASIASIVQFVDHPIEGNMEISPVET